MTGHDDGQPEKLERLIADVVRDLPLRRAPASLEARVRAGIERRARIPWWRRSFVHWPLPARAVFVIASLAMARLAVGAVAQIFVFLQATSASDPLVPAAGQLGATARALTAIGEAADLLVHTIPSGWLTVGLVLAGALYAALFGLGAAAYRALYLRR